MAEIETMVEDAEKTEPAEEANRGTNGMGLVTGIPGAHVSGVGVLDLRGVDPEELQKLKTVEGVGAILIDPSQKTALAHCRLEGVGAVLELAEGEQIMTQPFLEVTRAMLEGMAPGQKFTLLGVLAFAPDVPGSLVQEKIETLRLMGVLIASASVQGALFGRLQHSGVAVSLGDNVGPLVRNMGSTRLTPGYLARLTPGSSYLNLGHTEITPDVTEEVLDRAIGAYHNLGSTTGPAPLLELLRARCPNDLGAFDETPTA